MQPSRLKKTITIHVKARKIKPISQETGKCPMSFK